jgi:hypothetical protein
MGERLRHDAKDEKNHRVLFIHFRAYYSLPKACRSALDFAMTHRGQKLLCFGPWIRKYPYPNPAPCYSTRAVRLRRLSSPFASYPALMK